VGAAHDPGAAGERVFDWNAVVLDTDGIPETATNDPYTRCRCTKAPMTWRARLDW
jgi:hypothetical protein